jgi:hypothetical protein
VRYWRLPNKVMEQETFKFEFKAQEINTILGALTELLYKVSAPLIEAIHKQAQAQMPQPTVDISK